MKITQTPTDISGNIVYKKSVKMSLDVNASALIIRTLTNLYSKPYSAALREYASNAHDSHTRAGTTRPVEITLPSMLSPSLVIEDFGVGLDRDELEDFGQYGKSSKNESNDEIGGFGLGSKSGLAISSQFTVSAVKDGYKNTVIIGYDDTGAPTMGFLNESPTPTDAPNGVKISIPTTETHKFESAIEAHMFLGWPRGSVLINGKEPEVSISDSDVFTSIDGIAWANMNRLAKDGSAAQQIFAGSRSGISHALIGPVMYKIDWDSAGLYYETKSSFFSDVVLNLPIGSVDLIPSRENLLYSTRTKEKLRELINIVSARATDVYRDQVASSSSMREALVTFAVAKSHNFYDNDFAWQGHRLHQEIAEDEKFAGPDKTITVFELGYSSRRRNSSSPSYSPFQSTGDLNDRNSYIKLAAASEKITLVVGADSPTSLLRKGVPVSGTYRHQQSSFFIDYLQNLQSKDTTDTFSMFNRTYHIVSQDVDTLGPVFSGAYAKILPIEEVVAGAMEFRAERRKARAEERKAATPKLADPPSRLVTHGGVSTESLYSLDTSLKYIILQNAVGPSTHISTLSAQDRLNQTVRSAVTTMVGSNSISNNQRRAIAMIQDEYKILALNKSDDLSKYTAFLSNIFTIQEAVDSILSARIKSLSALEVLAATDLADRSNGVWGGSWVDQFCKDESLTNINRAETREWLKAVSKGVGVDGYTQTSILLNALDFFLMDRSAYTLPETSGLASPRERYPMLSLCWSLRARDVEHAVSYINLVDASLDGKAVTVS